jgi:hypothetical protein
VVGGNARGEVETVVVVVVVVVVVTEQVVFYFKTLGRNSTRQN